MYEVIKTEQRSIGVSVVVTVIAMVMVACATAQELAVAKGGKTDAIVVVSPQAGLPEVRDKDGAIGRGKSPKGKRNCEWLAAVDLVEYIGLMTGSRPRLVSKREEIVQALKGKAPVFLVGEEALIANPEFAARIRAKAKPNPVLRADSIGLLRDGKRVYLAGNHDEAHYYAVSALLHKWGCRWYMPTDFGECIPETPTLTLKQLDEVYAPPFEVRLYSRCWLASSEGQAEFQLRNYMTNKKKKGGVPAGHILQAYMKDLAEPGKSIFNVPIAEEETINHIVSKVAEKYEKGESFSLSMADGVYASDSTMDNKLKKLQYDKYFMTASMTDCFLTLYSSVARKLREQYPRSKSRIGFLAYSNMTLPPVTVKKVDPALVAYLAPIDIDPIHGMDDPLSPPRQEYRDIMYKWAEIMSGNVIIYDYDQSMLTWRDIPNPSIQGLEQDFRHYRKAGILGVDTESRMAMGTIFINLYCRAQLMWNPDVNLDDLLSEFYPKFYGPAAEPMRKYWTAIYDAWKKTIVTEHEFFVAPAIYTAQLLKKMRRYLEDAEKFIDPLRKKKNPTSRERLLLDRMRFTRLSFLITQNYMDMVHAAASDCDYGKAVAAGEAGLAARKEMTLMNDTFTTYKRPGRNGIAEKGPAWWPGEVQLYRDLQQYVDGAAGRMVLKLPLEWAFHRDPENMGLKEGWGLQPPDLSFWKERGSGFTLETRKDYPVTKWEVVRTDSYLQTQGIRAPDQQSYTGYGWYAAEVELRPDQVTKGIHIMFPGLFNVCWLYVNGKEVAYRKDYRHMWWRNNYKFQWHVDLSGKLKPGKNLITLRIHNPHHFGGMFRRPFLYSSSTKRKE